MKPYSTFRLSRIFDWSSANSLWTYSTGAGCCADEFLHTQASRYDLERFGCVPQDDPSRADLLIVAGLVTEKAAPELVSTFERMGDPKYVIAIGACACNGGPFQQNSVYSRIMTASDILPVDVVIPGCPPRPEAIMNGIITLQEKIKGMVAYE